MYSSSIRFNMLGRLAALALLAVPMAGRAAPTPLPEAQIRAYAQSDQLRSAGTATFTGCAPTPEFAVGWIGACGDVRASAAYGGGKAAVTVDGSFSHDENSGKAVGIGGWAMVEFYVVVDGPCLSDGDGGCLGVPVITSASGSAYAVGTMATATFRAPGGGFDACDGYVTSSDGIELANCGDRPGSFGGNISGHLQPGTVGAVHMDVTAGGGNYAYTKSASFFATVDPMIVIDPTFQYRDLYTLRVSPGGDTVPGPGPGHTVPVPGSLALVGLGLLSGLATRRRR